MSAGINCLLMLAALGWAINAAVFQSRREQHPNWKAQALVNTTLMAVAASVLMVRLS